MGPIGHYGLIIRSFEHRGTLLVNKPSGNYLLFKPLLTTLDHWRVAAPPLVAYRYATQPIRGKYMQLYLPYLRPCMHHVSSRMPIFHKILGYLLCKPYIITALLRFVFTLYARGFANPQSGETFQQVVHRKPRFCFYLAESDLNNWERRRYVFNLFIEG